MNDSDDGGFGGGRNRLLGDSDDEGGGAATVQMSEPDTEAEDDEFERETADEKRIRLAKEYLKRIEVLQYYSRLIH